MALAIEPMITLGVARHRRNSTTAGRSRTVDGSRAAHWEHTVAILDDGPWVLTAEDGGRAELEARGVRLSAAAAPTPPDSGQSGPQWLVTTDH